MKYSRKQRRAGAPKANPNNKYKKFYYFFLVFKDQCADEYDGPLESDVTDETLTDLFRFLVGNKEQKKKLLLRLLKYLLSSDGDVPLNIPIKHMFLIATDDHEIDPDYEETGDEPGSSSSSSRSSPTKKRKSA